MYLDYLFEPGLEFETYCVRCEKELEIWDYECTRCFTEDDYNTEENLEDYGLVYCSECPGIRVWINHRPIYVKCDYDIFTGKRGTISNCADCEYHFDWLDKKFEGFHYKEEKKKIKRRRNKGKKLNNKKKNKSKNKKNKSKNKKNKKHGK